MKKAGILITLLGLLFTRSLAGAPIGKADNLRKLLAPALKQHPVKPDTTTIKQLNDLAEDLFEAYPDSTAYYAGLAIKLSEKINYKKGLADGYVQVAAVNTFRGNFETSAQNFNKGLSYYQQAGDLPGVSECYIGLARIQDYLGNYKTAIAIYNKALQIRTKLGNEMDIADCYASMGITYDNMGEFSKALDHYFKALFIDVKHNDELAAADNYCNIGVIMQHMELYPKARTYFDKALEIWQQHKDTQGISTAYENIGEVLMAQNDLKNGGIYLNKASAIFQAMNDQEGISLIYYDLGIYNYRLKNPREALRYLNLALQSAGRYQIKFNKAQAYLGLAMVYNLEHTYDQAYRYATKAQATATSMGSLNTQADAAAEMSKALAGLGRFAEAYQQQQLQSRLKDTLKNNEDIQKLISYNQELDFNKKQYMMAEAYRQRSDKQRAVIVIGTIVVMILAVLALFYYRGRIKQKNINSLLTKKNQEIMQQKSDLGVQSEKMSELNDLKDRLIAILAHDLRGPLSTLRGLFALLNDKGISKDEFVEMAPRVFIKLEYTSDLLDTLLSWINVQVGTDPERSATLCDLDAVVKQELTYIDDMLYHKDLALTSDIDRSYQLAADPNCVRIVLHNLLTNAIKFSYRGGKIHISARQQDTEVVISVKDTGMGIDAAQLKALFKNKVNSVPGTDNEAGTGLGLFFCKDLVEKYNGRIWANSQPGDGAELCFALPLV